MPVRSSVCTYSPASASSKYALGATSSYSVGQYKPLASATGGRPSSSLTYQSAAPRSRYTPPTTYSPYSSGSSGLSSYSPSSSTATSVSSSSSSSSSSLSSSSSSSTSGHYKPFGDLSVRSSLSSRLNPSAPASKTGVLKYSSASSSSASSLSSAASDYLNYRPPHPTTSSAYSSSSLSYNYSPTSRRLSSSSLSRHHQSPSEPLPAGVPRGLINLGTTCYMNAVMQALYSIESFRSLLLARSVASIKQPDKILTSELSDLFKLMRNSSAPISPNNFKYVFSSRHGSKFSGYGQQDAQEFLRYLINGVHEEANRAGQGLSRARSGPRTAEEAWRQYRDVVDDSPLVDLVVGQLCSTIVCSQCGNESHCWDPFWDLSLPLARGRHSCRLTDVIDDFTAKETLDSDERPSCSQCKRPTRSTKQISLSRLPQVLILHLKKFSNDGYKLTSPEVKIDKQLTFNQTTSYTLKACISHHGHSSSSGHYTSHCEYDSRWFHFNDERVRDVTNTFDSDRLEDAYVLFYVRWPGTGRRGSVLAAANHVNYQSKL